MEQSNETILSMNHIKMHFPGVRAVDDVTFELRKGEVHALLGENGAGKSTLMKVLLGINQMQAGEIVYQGNPVKIHGPSEALNMGISMIHQELMDIPEMTIAENVWVGREPVKGPLKLVDTQEMVKRTKTYLEKFRLEYDPRMQIKNLTIAGKQLVEIIRATSYNSRIVIMDEPTSALEEGEVEKLFGIIRELKSAGTAIIYISHKLDEIFRIADRVSVMRDGKMIRTDEAANLNREQIISLMVGREMNQVFPDRGEMKIGEEVLRVEGFTLQNKFENIGFSVMAGEILGISGLMGAGRTETMEAIFGYGPLDKGDVYFHGKKVRIRSPHDAINLGMAWVTEDRKSKGLVLCRSVCENISLVHLKNVCRNGFLSWRKERAEASRMQGIFKIKPPNLDTKVNSLSGGNQQKVVLGKWMMQKPKLLILDEPTRGIDVGAKYEIYKQIIELASQDIAIIMISSEMPEIIGMSDRILVMHNGRISGEFSRSEATQELLMTAALA